MPWSLITMLATNIVRESIATKDCSGKLDSLKNEGRPSVLTPAPEKRERKIKLKIKYSDYL